MGTLSCFFASKRALEHVFWYLKGQLGIDFGSLEKNYAYFGSQENSVAHVLALKRALQWVLTPRGTVYHVLTNQRER